jgi:glycosyltransferase involved in cell wall biosynthesis
MRVVLTLHTAGQDEPEAVRARSAMEYRAFVAADRVLSVSPRLSERYLAAGLPKAKLAETVNGIDTDRFCPAGASTRAALGRELSLPDARIILFVGFFSRDKQPDVLFDAWLALASAASVPPALVCVGATASPYYEVDRSLADRMRAAAAGRGLGGHLCLVRPTRAIERYFRAADVFALPSAREALPMALLEAMACALPVVASRLPGATDRIVDDGVNGRLVEPGDAGALASAIGALLADPGEASRLGAAARRTIEERFSLERAAAGWLDAYRQVLAS